MSRVRYLLMSCAVPLCLLSGCTQPLNDRLALGGQFVSPSLRGQTTDGVDPVPPDLFGQPPELERERWQPTQFVVHFDGVVHGQPLRIGRPLRANDPPRVYGRYPTRSDALDPQANGWFDDLRLGVSETGRSVIGGPFALIYLAVSGELAQPAVSPGSYKRSRQDDWSSGRPAPVHSSEHTKDE